MRQRPITYKPVEFARPTREEVRNGFTAETLTAYLRNSCDTEFEFRAALLIRARDCERIAHAAAARFERDEDLTVAENQERLAELEREASEATIDAGFAADKYTETSEAAA